MTVMEIITLISCVLGMCVTVCSLIRPIINLNNSITKLNDTVEVLQGDMMSYKNDAKVISTGLIDLTNRVYVIEEQIKVANHRLEDLERK